MGERQKTSFSQVAFVEAVARQATVGLVIRPIHPGSGGRLCSRFLGLCGNGDLILAAPGARTDQKKVFLPIGWELEMTFPLADLLLRASTCVLGHCQHAQHPTRRIDAIVVRRPSKVTTLNRRRFPRQEADPSVRVPVSVWPSLELRAGPCGPPRIGLLANRSRTGLGVRFAAKLQAGVGSEVILRLEDHAAEACAIHRAVVKHCTPAPGGKWLVGFGQAVELGPGEAVPIMESLVLAGQ